MEHQAWRPEAQQGGWQPGPTPLPGPGPQHRGADTAACACLGDGDQFLGFIGDQQEEGLYN
jgi:hypothetical protein